VLSLWIIVIIDGAGILLQRNELENRIPNRLSDCHHLFLLPTAMQFPAWHLYLSFLTHLTRAEGKQDNQSTKL